MHRLSRELYTFFTSLKDAPNDVQSMLKELEQVKMISQNIQSNAREYMNSPFTTDDGLCISRISYVLQDYQDELTKLQAVVEASKLKKLSGAAKEPGEPSQGYSTSRRSHSLVRDWRDSSFHSLLT